MALTKELYVSMFKVFGTIEFEDIKEEIPFELSKMDIRKGTRKNIQSCMYQQCSTRTLGAHASLMTENYFYIQYKKGGVVYRGQNTTDLKENIKTFDETGEGETGTFIIKPPKGSRTLEYHKKRRKNIKDGTHTFRKRGPNLNPRKKIVHYRPF